MNQEELLGLLRPETKKIDHVMRQDLAGINNSLLSEVIEYAIFNGGKRVRPLLAILWTKLCLAGAEDEMTPEHYLFSLLFEYLHAASLLHDDVIDRAKTRRGRKAANLVWDNTHVILAGDFLHARAMLLAGTIGGNECLKKISSATTAMVESEFLQLQNATSHDLSEDNYYKVLQGKTTSLITAACETGVILGKGNSEQQQAARLYGTNLGHTFQIVDDLLDYLGDPGRTGKAVGNDFQEGKMTLPLIYAIKHASPQNKKILSQLLDANSQDRLNNFDSALTIIEQSGGFTYAKQKAKTLINGASDSLQIFPQNPAKNILAALSSYVLNRDK